MPIRDSFKDIVFKKENHTYQCFSNNIGVDLTSVTKLISTIKPPFDRDGISKMVAQKTFKSQEEVLASWDQKSADALDKGSCVHAYIEDLFKGIDDPLITEVNDLPECQGFKDAWAKLQKTNNIKMVEQEIVIGDLSLGAAGMVDAIVEVMIDDKEKDEKKTVLSTFDFKTGKKFESKSNYGGLLPPFQDLDNCHLNLYSIQVSTYRLILERKCPDLKFTDGYLVWLKDDGKFRVFRARDYRDRCLSWLTERGF